MSGLVGAAIHRSIVENAKKKPGQIQVIKNVAGQWYVRTVAANWEIISVRESYDTKSNATRAAAEEAKIRGWPITYPDPAMPTLDSE